MYIYSPIVVGWIHYIYALCMEEPFNRPTFAVPSQSFHDVSGDPSVDLTR